jgi:hypothetical protein
MHDGAAHLAPEHARVGFRWSWQRVHEMRASLGRTYDLVFNARFDLWLDAPLVLRMPEPGVFYGGRNTTAIRRGVDGEVFAYGTPAVMMAMYVPAVPRAFEGVAASCGFVGEKLVTEIRKSHGFRYEPVEARYGFLRPNGVAWVNQ